AVAWMVGPATVSVDLGAGAFTASLRLTEPDLPPISVDVSMVATGVSATAAVGDIDDHAGGLRLVATTQPSATVALEWAGPSLDAAASPRSVPVLPSPDAAGLRDLVTVLLPAVAAQGLLSSLRQFVPSPAQAGLDAVLD